MFSALPARIYLILITVGKDQHHCVTDEKTKVVAWGTKASIFQSRDKLASSRSLNQNTSHDATLEWNEREKGRGCCLPEWALLFTTPMGTPRPAGPAELNPAILHHLQISSCHIDKLATGLGVLAVKCTHLIMILRRTQIDVGGRLDYS